MRSPAPLMLMLMLLTMLMPAGPAPASAAQCDVSVGDIDFGPVDTLSAGDTLASAEVTISCDQVTETAEAVTICGNFGIGSGGADGSARLLSSGSGALRYGLYSDEAGGHPWGHYGNPGLGEPVRTVLTASGGLASGSVTLYGLAFGSQPGAAPASYASLFDGSDAQFNYDEGTTLDCSAPGGQSVDTSLSVAATVEPNCLVVAGDLDFGTTGVIDHDIDASADLAVTCTPGTGYDISLNGGSNGGSSSGPRLMRSGSDTISYGLFLDPERREPWGEGSLVKPGEGLGATETHTVYGRVPPQGAPVGSYTDTVVVTIAYH